MATISGGADKCGWERARIDDGRGIARSGFAKRAVSDAAWDEVGVRASRFVGRLERGSCEVGMLSGMGSDIVGVQERVPDEGREGGCVIKEAVIVSVGGLRMGAEMFVVRHVHATRLWFGPGISQLRALY